MKLQQKKSRQITKNNNNTIINAPPLKPNRPKKNPLNRAKNHFQPNQLFTDRKRRRASNNTVQHTTLICRTGSSLLGLDSKTTISNAVNQLSVVFVFTFLFLY
ncbi:unnamed protein product [Ceratitis capitata]|uniref:(Mediterranean fruit fly) hypothetical protein n=1 Tax=Ceratitis capitata TaxID=7213 RepID=A0A811UPQ9_CERCA|nr:unnamed protein product [Ceratitis capitata]